MLLIYLLDASLTYCGLGGGVGGLPPQSRASLPPPATSPSRGKKRDSRALGAAAVSDAGDGAARLRSAMLTTLALAAHNAPEGLAVGMARFAPLRFQINTSAAQYTHVDPPFRPSFKERFAIREA